MSHLAGRAYFDGLCQHGEGSVAEVVGRMAREGDEAGRILHLLVADALEALIPLVDGWAAEVKDRPRVAALQAQAQAYDRGVDAMAAEVKDQLVERILRLRSQD
jgi:hypothetical protein